MAGFITFLVLLSLGFFVGRMNERNHFKRLKAAEAELAHIMVTNLKQVSNDLEPGAVLVSGNVVIAVDYFKVLVVSLKTLIGGRLGSYESLVARARREAIIRMKREAEDLGANKIYNVRLEFSSIGQQPRMGGAELLAYGTAVKTL